MEIRERLERLALSRRGSARGRTSRRRGRRRARRSGPSSRRRRRRLVTARGGASACTTRRRSRSRPGSATRRASRRAARRRGSRAARRRRPRARGRGSISSSNPLETTWTSQPAACARARRTRRTPRDLRLVEHPADDLFERSRDRDELAHDHLAQRQAALIEAVLDLLVDSRVAELERDPVGARSDSVTVPSKSRTTERLTGSRS